WTASARTIGVTMTSLPTPLNRKRRFRLQREGRLRVKSEQHAAKPLQRRGWQLALGTARVIPLHVVLTEREDRRHREVPGARDEQQLNDVEVRAGDLLGPGEELGDGGDEGQRR